MQERLKLRGMILSVAPAGEYDRRLTILTAERGKITAFARGARRPKSSLLGVTRPFVFGSFFLIEGRDSYSLDEVQADHYFDELTGDLERSGYGSYFLEFASYYSREGLGAAGLLNLLVVTMLVMIRTDRPLRQVRSVFELRCMAENGEYSEQPLSDHGETAAYAWRHVLSAPLRNLYSFTLSEEALSAFADAVTELCDYYIDRKFRSLEILSSLA